MSSPVVLITGALTGIGRAAAILFVLHPFVERIACRSAPRHVPFSERAARGHDGLLTSSTLDARAVIGASTTSIVVGASNWTIARL
jgi:NAD(P)-dependent dehydrogenase (short-subunit alcohol dehydrogenase family)